jgi:methylated-DNA-[protein]-cysteine S-methyltransferase
LNYFHFPVGFGTLLISWSSQGLLSRIEWAESRLAWLEKVKVPPYLADLIDQIRGYFYAGEPIDSIPWGYLDQSEWTDFQKKVYRAIAEIPHGETRTYGWVAKKIEHPAASRAVGQALRKNPLPILIPCHRVLASSSIGGFMGVIDPSQPELKLKQKLMSLEDGYRCPAFAFFPYTNTRHINNAF